MIEPEKHNKELGEGLMPDAGPGPDREVTWPGFSVVAIAIVGIAVFTWAYLADSSM